MSERRTLETVFSGSPVEASLARRLPEADGLTAYLSDEHIGTVAPYVAAGGGAGAVPEPGRPGRLGRAAA
jgi:hypothetical protein